MHHMSMIYYRRPTNSEIFNSIAKHQIKKVWKNKIYNKNLRQNWTNESQKTRCYVRVMLVLRSLITATFQQKTRLPR